MGRDWSRGCAASMKLDDRAGEYGKGADRMIGHRPIEKDRIGEDRNQRKVLKGKGR